MRANVYISSTGFCSRREADRFIEAGRVIVNGKQAITGMNIEENDIVEIDGKPLKIKPETVYIMYNKPRGIESTTDPEKKDNIIDAINYPERIFPIGRLDKDSSGLILLTNDGMIVNRILRSENNHEKEYLVTVDKVLTKEFLDAMSKGVDIYNPVKHVRQITLPAKLKKIGPKSFSIILTQGLNLQIRRMAKQLGYKVLTLHRIRIMNLNIGKLEEGTYRLLTDKEVSDVLHLLEEN